MPKLSLEKLGPREKWGLGLAIGFVFVLLVDQVVVRAVTSRLDDLDALIEKQADELAYNTGVAEAAPAVEAEYAPIEGALASDLSESEAIDAITGEIDDVAQVSRLVLDSMEHREARVLPSHSEHIIEIEFEWSTEGLLGFLDRVWSSPGMLRVQKLSLEPGKKPDTVKGTAVISKILVPG